MKHLISALLLSAATLAAQAPTAWTPELSLQLKGVGAVTPSPNGHLIAYTQTEAVMEDEVSEMRTHIFLAQSDGSKRVQLTRGEKSAAGPEFSPDGRYIYFSSERSGKPNLYRIAVDGGEAEMLTAWKGAIGSFRVSPDGKWVAFTGREEDKEEEKRKKGRLDLRVIDDKPKNHALWLVPSESRIDGKREPRQLATGPFHILRIAWAPDSRAIAFEHQPAPEADHWPKMDISEVEVESGKVKTLASTPAAERNPSYSRDGKHLAYTRSAEPAKWAGDDRIVLLNRQSGEMRPLPSTYDENPQLLGWPANSSGVLFSETRNTRSAIYEMPVDGPVRTVYAPAEGVLLGANLNATGTHIGFAYETTGEAVEAYVLAPGAAGKPIRVSRANSDLAKPPVGKTQVIRWKSKDGLEIEGLLTYPVDYEKGKRYPLILNIHGGPAGVFGESFLGRGGLYPMAAFASKGFSILRCNIRGSGGYGKKFRFANLNDWGGKDYEDLMAGVDHVIGLGVADPDRMAVMGWSYGGFMTSWVVTQTKRFKAAVVGAGVTNLWSFTGTADIPSFLPDYFSGEPWDNFKAYQAHSPMSFVKNVSTPTLILHGENDLRVPVSQGYELYNALKRQGVTTKMVVYPRMPHGPTEPKFMLDIMNRHIEWLETYVQ
jgi:dipeptidyl aminopeptidase/acylaminoacyl peptidase